MNQANSSKEVKVTQYFDVEAVEADPSNEEEEIDSEEDAIGEEVNFSDKVSSLSAYLKKEVLVIDPVQKF